MIATALTDLLGIEVPLINAPMTPQIVLEMTDRPVVAAGGIATGRGLAAVLAAAGQSVGLLDTVSPAATIVASIETQAQELLRRW